MLNVLHNLSHYTVNSWSLYTFSVHAVCPVQILKMHISQRAVECATEVQIEACADSLFWHAGAAEW